MLLNLFDIRLEVSGYREDFHTRNFGHSRCKHFQTSLGTRYRREMMPLYLNNSVS